MTWPLMVYVCGEAWERACMCLPALVYMWGECVSVPRKGSSFIPYFLSESLFSAVSLRMSLLPIQPLSENV